MKQSGALILILMICNGVMALDNRDEFVDQLIDPSETVIGAEGLFESYQLGGVRTIIKNLNKMPADLALQYAHAMSNLDLFRFRNDMNGNLQSAKTVEQKGAALLLLSSLGRKIDSGIFLEFAEDINEDIRVRLAAATCLAAIQNPTYFELFAEIAETSIVDPATGRNDFIYCDYTNISRGLFYTLKPKLDVKSTAKHGVIMVMLQVVKPGHNEFYTKLIDLRRKEYYDMMINQAARAGAVDLLDTIANHKKAKKVWDMAKSARPAALMVAKYRDQLFNKSNKKKYPIGSLIPPQYAANGRDGYSASFAILKVDAEGVMSVVQEESILGSKGPFSALNGKKTMAAKLDFAPIESLYFVVSPN